MIIQEPIIIENSPVEFILIGSNGEADRILVKSSNAGLDLLGLANFDYHIPDNFATIRDSSFIPTQYRSLNVLESKNEVISDSLQLNSTRKSSYRFVWAGQCSSSGKERILEILN